MSGKSRYVFDTNAVVSALLIEESTPSRAIRAARMHGELLISAELAAEIVGVLRRERFDQYVTPQERDRFVVALLQDCKLIDVHEVVSECRDPKDNHVLALAVEGTATCIVSGDKDLVSLDTFRGIPIRTPAGFLRSMAERA
jgi:putative PIN family toxin of toxin-antitoxin system